MRRRIDSKGQLRDALESIILRKLSEAEEMHERELEQAEREKGERGNVDHYRFVKRLKPVAFEFYPDFKLKLNIPWVCPDPVADWAFSSTSWALATDKYVSPPSSICSTTSDLRLVCIASGAHPINEGRINSYFYTASGWSTGCIFRAQYPSWSNNYRMRKKYLSSPPHSVTLYRDDGQIATANSSYGTANSWQRWQVKFYVSEGHLVVRPEFWVAAESRFVQDVDDFLDPLNKYNGSSSNYAGILLSSSCYADDTEIWRAS